jgi:hypothetical protein
MNRRNREEVNEVNDPGTGAAIGQHRRYGGRYRSDVVDGRDESIRCSDFANDRCVFAGRVLQLAGKPTSSDFGGT